jgi:hypothetical protein
VLDAENEQHESGKRKVDLKTTVETERQDHVSMAADGQGRQCDRSKILTITV